MNRVNLTALVIVAVAQCCQAQEYSVYDYLDLPKADELNEPLHKNVSDAIIKLGIDEKSDVYKLSEQPRDLESESPELELLYKAIDISRSEVNSIHSIKSLIPIVKSIVAQVRAKPKSEMSFYANNFLEFVAKPIFMSLRRSIRGTYDSHKDTVDELDTIFCKAFGVNKNRLEWQQKLDGKLKDFNLAEDKLDVPKMVKKIKKIKKTGTVYKTRAIKLLSGERMAERKRKEVYRFLGWTEEEIKDAEERPLQTVVDFINSKCGHFSNREVTLDALHLAAFLEQGEKLSDRTFINHYTRLCRDWKEPETSKKIVRNFKLQLKGSTNWSMLKF